MAYVMYECDAWESCIRDGVESMDMERVMHGIEMAKSAVDCASNDYACMELMLRGAKVVHYAISVANRAGLPEGAYECAMRLAQFLLWEMTYSAEERFGSHHRWFICDHDDAYFFLQAVPRGDCELSLYAYFSQMTVFERDLSRAVAMYNRLAKLEEDLPSALAVPISLERTLMTFQSLHGFEYVDATGALTTWKVSSGSVTLGGSLAEAAQCMILNYADEDCYVHDVEYGYVRSSIVLILEAECVDFPPVVREMFVRMHHACTDIQHNVDNAVEKAAFVAGKAYIAEQKKVCGYYIELWRKVARYVKARGIGFYLMQITVEAKEAPGGLKDIYDREAFENSLPGADSDETKAEAVERMGKLAVKYAITGDKRKFDEVVLAMTGRVSDQKLQKMRRSVALMRERVGRCAALQL